MGKDELLEMGMTEQQFLSIDRTLHPSKYSARKKKSRMKNKLKLARVLGKKKGPLSFGKIMQKEKVNTQSVSTPATKESKEESHEKSKKRVSFDLSPVESQLKVKQAGNESLIKKKSETAPESKSSESAALHHTDQSQLKRISLRAKASKKITKVFCAGGT